MDELSLYVLDITMNSVRAGATEISVTLTQDDEYLTFSVTDNGCGMTKEQVEKLSNPFFTTRTTRISTTTTTTTRITATVNNNIDTNWSRKPIGTSWTTDKSK